MSGIAEKKCDCDLCRWCDVEETKLPRTYQVGKWYLETGPYAAWKRAELEKFSQKYNIVKVDPIPTNDGGMLLLVDATKKEKPNVSTETV
jgi:hypothetical protein